MMMSWDAGSFPAFQRPSLLASQLTSDFILKCYKSIRHIFFSYFFIRLFFLRNTTIFILFTDCNLYFGLVKGI